MNELINLPAIKALWKYRNKLLLLKPDLVYQSFISVDIKELKRRHVNHIVIDKDNTLTIPYELKYANEEIKMKMKEFCNEFGYQNIAVLSNSINSKQCKGYDSLIKEMGVGIIEHQYPKPKVHDNIKKYFGLMDPIKDKKEICIIGDRLLVDVLTGKINGYTTVLLSSPITSQKENICIKTARLFENYLMNSYTI